MLLKHDGPPNCSTRTQGQPDDTGGSSIEYLANPGRDASVLPRHASDPGNESADFERRAELTEGVLAIQLQAIERRGGRDNRDRLILLRPSRTPAMRN